MSSQTGRPKSENPKDIEIKARIDDSTYRQIMDYCEKHQINRTEFVREGIALMLQKNKRKGRKPS